MAGQEEEEGEEEAEEEGDDTTAYQGVPPAGVVSALLSCSARSPAIY